MKPFPNLLTMLPVFNNGGTSATHYIGIQSNLYNADHVVSRFLVGNQKLSYLLPLPPEKNAIGISLAASEKSAKSVLPILSSYNLFSATCDIADKMISIFSIRGLILYLSPIACNNILKCEPSALVGTNVSAYLHPADKVHVLRALKNASSDEVVIDINCRVKKDLADYAYVNISGKLSIAKGVRSLILSIKPIFLSNVGLSSIVLSSLKTSAFLKLSPQLLILYRSKGLADILEANVIGSRLCDVFKFAESEEHIMLSIKQSSPTLLKCKVSNVATHIRVLQTHDIRGSTLIAQVFSGSEKAAREDKPKLSGNLYDLNGESADISLFSEVTNLLRNNKLLQGEIAMFQGALGLAKISGMQSKQTLALED
jgi:hypothetical protein